MFMLDWFINLNSPGAKVEPVAPPPHQSTFLTWGGALWSKFMYFAC